MHDPVRRPGVDAHGPAREPLVLLGHGLGQDGYERGPRRVGGGLTVSGPDGGVQGGGPRSSDGSGGGAWGDSRGAVGQDSPDIVTCIAHLARLVAAMRSVPANNGADAQKTEQPWRAFNVLHNIARGHALVAGRRYLTKEDLPTVARVAVSSTPPDVRKVLPLLAHSPEGVLTVEETRAGLGVAHWTPPATPYERRRTVGSSGSRRPARESRRPPIFDPTGRGAGLHPSGAAGGTTYHQLGGVCEHHLHPSPHLAQRRSERGEEKRQRERDTHNPGGVTGFDQGV